MKIFTYTKAYMTLKKDLSTHSLIIELNNHMKKYNH